ncbi:DUF3237 family protein [Lactobacillus curvatus]|uniref:DUF3237 domain-containing protein n=1 Tax=Latilactobacillus fragifolii TaxID=2814244 RepID=UPI0012B12141|nr:DUF3237 domain-containing protein [Latilactobacillus fragifolii]MSD83907.1 DUF3237 family protein [Latilactobacillus curvatus]MSE24227.1 DUF3237 family protein [Latilactobacillus curvatus]
MANQQPALEFKFSIKVSVDKPVFVGQSADQGRRQLIPIIDGLVEGVINGHLLSGGIDSQIIRPNGATEVSARYGVKLDDGRSFYIQNDGIRTVPAEYVAEVLKGHIIDSDKVYFTTVPRFEIYDESLSWLTTNIFICQAKRLPDKVILNYYCVK